MPERLVVRGFETVADRKFFDRTQSYPQKYVVGKSVDYVCRYRVNKSVFIFYLFNKT